MSRLRGKANSVVDLLLQDWKDLDIRLQRAGALLRWAGDNAVDPVESARLHAKAEGVLLALSYLREHDGEK